MILIHYWINKHALMQYDSYNNWWVIDDSDLCKQQNEQLPD